MDKLNPLPLTASLLRTLIVPYDDPFESRDATTQTEEIPSVTPPTGNFVRYQGLNVPDRLLSWFKSPQKAEAFTILFAEEPTKVSFVPCPPNVSKNKDNVCFYVIRPDRQRGYYSQEYQTLEEAYNDLFYLCENLGDNPSFQKITQVLDKAKREYLIKTGQY